VVLGVQEPDRYDRIAMLSKHDDGRRRVTGTAHDRAPSHDDGSMIEFSFKEQKVA
jgi:hypothetical protein